MPPTPATPSPHRFLAQREPRTAKAPSAQRKSVSQTPKFVTTPASQLPPLARRFTFAQPPPADGGALPDGLQKALPCGQKPKPVRKLQRVESIEDASQGSLGGLEHEAFGQPFTENTERPADSSDEELLFAPSNRKRRRLSPPQTPAPQSHRFLPQPPSEPPFTHPVTTTSTRPAFLVPSHISDSPPSQPLPDAFSPQRRGHKFVPGGLASVLQGWVIDVAHTASHSAGSMGNVVRAEHDDGQRIRILVTAVRPTQSLSPEITESSNLDSSGHRVMHLVQGSLDSTSRSVRDAGGGGEASAVLAARNTRASRGTKLGLGSLVGIRSPCWDVDICGRKWVVGVEWSVS
ncbi:hypothetical protein K432DRAFT_357684, partial [Lepidopterella palustris CBS 459.81]